MWLGNAKNRHTGVPEKTPRPQLLLLLSTGSSYYDNVRPLAYPDSDAVLICFDISRPETLDSVIKKVSNHFISPHGRQHLNSAASLEDVFVLLISIFVDSEVLRWTQRIRSIGSLKYLTPDARRNEIFRVCSRKT